MRYRPLELKVRVCAAIALFALGSAPARPAEPPARKISPMAAAVAAAIAAAPHAPTAAQARDQATTTPIKHLIVVLGRGRSFDHLFGAYRSIPGDRVRNILSEGVIDTLGRPGPNFAEAAQNEAIDTAAYSISPIRVRPYARLPATLFRFGRAAPASSTPDLRVSDLANGPFPLAPGLLHDDEARSPVNRFYQMSQQMDCSGAYATPANPSGCRLDLFPWVAVTAGAGSNGNSRAADFTSGSTREGAISMGFYDTHKDAPYLEELARAYTLLDNYHQAARGGVAPNALYFAFADALWYSDGAGQPAAPPRDQIEDPNPQAGTNNWWIEDGYLGGSYSKCSDPSEPGVGPIANYLSGMGLATNCDPARFYMLNDLNPGYLGAGQLANPPAGSTPSPSEGPFTLPPSPVASLGDVMIANQVSWVYYGANWDIYLANTEDMDLKALYCKTCNPFLYESGVMAGVDKPSGLAFRLSHLKDTIDLFSDIRTSRLPAVSFVKPHDLDDSRPDTTRIAFFESFLKSLIGEVTANPSIAGDTAIMITFTDGGGYWDSGYVQPIDFFGDGPRVAMIIVSPFSKGGRVSHVYSDHASVTKFIEANWSLPKISGRSRDNLRNPIQTGPNPYAPVNGPALSDLMAAFDFTSDAPGK